MNRSYFPIQAIPFLLIILFFSCEKEISFNGKKSDPVIVMNGIIRPDSAIKLRLTESRFFLTPVTDQTFPPVTDATIILRSDEKEIARLTHTGNGNYESDYIPQPGERLNISAESVSMKKQAGCSAIIPSAPAILSISTEAMLLDTFTYQGWTENTTITSSCDKMTIRFLDPEASSDYYRIALTLHIKRANGATEHIPIQYSSDNIVFGANDADILQEGDRNRYKVFADELVNGKEHDFTLSWFYHSYYPSDSDNKLVSAELSVELHHIAKDYFLYLKTLGAVQSSGDFGELLTEPVQIFSNISGGIGIIGAYSFDRRVLKLK
jgi:hypothetical protein